MVEHKLFAEYPPEQAEEPIGLRGIAGVNDVEPLASQRYVKGFHESPEQAPGKLGDESNCAPGIHGQGVAVDIDTLKPLK